MSEQRSLSIGAVVRAFVFLFVLGAIGGALFVWSGVYNVAAGKEHFRITNWVLAIVRDQSIKTYAGGVEAPNLDDPDRIVLGAGHYRDGCEWCHGVPGGSRNPAVRYMLPAPPRLELASSDYDDEELFWIVKNGLKYTGMPAWPAPDRDDEVWSVVAYVKHLHNVAISGGHQVEVPSSARADAVTLAEDLGCADCHGDANSEPIGSYVPILAGQSQAYLERAMIEYRSGARDSGFMSVAAAPLTDHQVAEISNYYAGLAPPDGKSSDIAGSMEQGANIAQKGLPQADIPACLACHAGEVSASFPKLAGQPAPYLEQQLRLWQAGQRRTSGYGAIMATIAQRLDEEQIRQVSAYFAFMDHKIRKEEP